MWTNTRCGDNFRSLMNQWEHYSQLWEENDEKARKVRMLLDGGPYVMYFSDTNGNIFGMPEEGRLAFATLKNPMKGDPVGADLKFPANDVCQLLNGNKIVSLFGKDKVNKLKVHSDKDELFDMIMDKLKDMVPPLDSDEEIIKKVNVADTMSKKKDKKNKKPIEEKD